MRVGPLIDEPFLAYNGGRLQKACRLFCEKLLQEDVTIGLSLSGALTPAGVSAPERLRPIVTSSCSSFSQKSRQAFCSRPPLYARKGSSIRGPTRMRTEEARGGQGCRARWSPDQ